MTSKVMVPNQVQGHMTTTLSLTSSKTNAIPHNIHNELVSSNILPEYSSSSDDDDSDGEETGEEEEEEEEEEVERKEEGVGRGRGSSRVEDIFCKGKTTLSCENKLLHKRKSLDNNAVTTEEIKLRKKVEERGHRLLQENEPRWRETVRQQMESELSRRVREALETPPLERIQKRNDEARQRHPDDINSHLLIDLTDREGDLLRTKRWKTMQAKKMGEKRELSFVTKKNLEWSVDGLKVSNQRYDNKKNVEMQLLFQDQLCPSNQDQYPGVFGLGNLSEGIKNIRDDYSVSVSRYPGAKPKLRHFYTKEGFMKALRTGNLPTGVQFIDDCGTYIDKYGVVRNGDGPFWPVESVPMFATPRFKWWTSFQLEPFSYSLPQLVLDADIQPPHPVSNQFCQ